jgi:hypothetical protein
VPGASRRPPRAAESPLNPKKKTLFCRKRKNLPIRHPHPRVFPPFGLIFPHRSSVRSRYTRPNNSYTLLTVNPRAGSGKTDLRANRISTGQPCPGSESDRPLFVLPTETTSTRYRFRCGTTIQRTTAGKTSNDRKNHRGSK